MNAFETTKIPDAIEVIFCKEFEECIKSKNHPMDTELGELLIQLMVCGDLNIPEAEKPFIYKLIEKRIDALHTYKLEPKAILLLSFVAERAGIAVMYIWYLQYISKKRNIKEMDMDYIIKKVFVNGFPKPDELHAVWDNQKVNTGQNTGSDNLLDYYTAGESILN